MPQSEHNYIDFHGGSYDGDYSSRIIDSGNGMFFDQKNGHNVSVEDLYKSVNAINNINIYVGADGKLHFVDKAGADTALNFSSGYKVQTFSKTFNTGTKLEWTGTYRSFSFVPEGEPYLVVAVGPNQSLAFRCIDYNNALNYVACTSDNGDWHGKTYSGQDWSSSGITMVIGRHSGYESSAVNFFCFYK